MLADETAHIHFHSERLAAGRRHWPTAARALWALQFRVILRAAMYAEWLDHRGALRAVGATRREYARRCRSESRRSSTR